MKADEHAMGRAWVEVYQDKGAWRWRAKSEGGTVVAESPKADGYPTKADAEKAARGLLEAILRVAVDVRVIEPEPAVVAPAPAPAAPLAADEEEETPDEPTHAKAKAPWKRGGGR